MAAAAGADADRRNRDEHDEKVRFFNKFLYNNRDDWAKKITQELANDRYRIPVELRDVEEAQPGLARQVLEAPVKYLLPWEEALLSFLRDQDDKKVRQLKQPLKLDLTGAFGQNHVTPRGLTARTLGNLMKVEGIIIKSGLMVPKLLQSMHVRKRIDDHVETREHRDATSLASSPNAGGMPTHDSDGNELQIEIGLSIYKDYQTFTIQEAPDSAPPGQIPQHIEVVCEGDLADKVKPGDRVQVTGVYKTFPPLLQDVTTGLFPSRLVATSIRKVTEMIEAPFVPDDLRHIKEIARRPDVFELLARSFAPSICGHANPKAGMLLQMVGGSEKNLANGTHIRGDINILMVGDPSCGKSQMLRFVMNTAQNAISTTGRGSSGVGLTAAVTREPGARDFQITAGAMVLADRGTICIDEFDKMTEADRVALHEAMEQQVVTISKAGMHVSLNARCSVLAAANPKYGSFDPSMDLAKNIGLPDSLLSRFDLIFIVRDLTNEDIDRKIASQVLRQAMMRYGDDWRRRGVEQVHSSILERRQENDSQQTQEATEVFAPTVAGPNGEEGPQVVTVDFLRKYIRYCKRLTPVLTPEAQVEVADKYVDLRRRFQSGFADVVDPNSQRKPRLAVTTRTLEALIRLATAHAKLKLRKDEVLPEDVQQAYKLMLAAREEDDPVPPVEQPDSQEAPTQSSTQRSTRVTGKKRPRDEAQVAAERVPAEIAPGRLDVLINLVARFFARQDMQEIAKALLLEGVNAELVEGENPFSQQEFEAGLAKLEERNKVMINPDDNDTVILVDV